MRLRDQVPEGVTRVMLFQNSGDGSCVIAVVTHFNAQHRREMMKALATGECVGPTATASQSLILGLRLVIASVEAAISWLAFQPKRAYNYWRRG